MIPRSRPDSRRTAGQVLIEFALVVPLLATIFVIVIHYGIIFWATLGVSSSVREAALYASYHPDDAALIEQACRASIPSFLNTSHVTVQVTYENASTKAEGTSVSVSATYNISAAGSLPGGQFLPTPNQIGASVTSPILVP